MKIYVQAYLSENLGDDLFVKILTERYPKHRFYSISNNFNNYNNNENYQNLKVYTNKYLYKLIRKLKLEKNIANRCELAVTIGGSMFIENNEKAKYKEFTLGKNKHYILGSNFGPYKTQEYFNNVRKSFEKAEDVCFREKYTYDIFKDLPNVRYASDIVFSMNTDKIKITNRKRAIISIISCSAKLDEKYTEKYEAKIIELMKFLINKGYEICLMSFCKREKDEEAIESIINKCSEELKNRIETYYYRGNIKEALNVIGDSSLVIGSRFHANILGLLLRKPTIPVIYSDKTIHVLEDMNIDLKKIDIREIDTFDISSISDEDLNKIIDVSKQKIDSNRHFEFLDKELGNE